MDAEIENHCWLGARADGSRNGEPVVEIRATSNWSDLPSGKSQNCSDLNQEKWFEHEVTDANEPTPSVLESEAASMGNPQKGGATFLFGLEYSHMWSSRRRPASPSTACMFQPQSWGVA